jgi:hypothetical protein
VLVTPLGVLLALPLVGAGVVVTVPVLGAADDGVVEAGVLSVLPGVADGPFGFGAADAGGAPGSTAPFDVVVVVPVLDFFEVSGCVVCCAAAGTDRAATNTAASAYRCDMVELSCIMVRGCSASCRRTIPTSPQIPCSYDAES